MFNKFALGEQFAVRAEQRLQLLFRFRLDLLVGADSGKNHRCPSPQFLQQALFVARNIFDLDAVEEALNARENHTDLFFDRERRILRLFQQFGQAAAAVKQLLRRASRSDANCENASISRNCASSSLIEPATCFIALICAAEPTRLTDKPTLIAGRTPL